MDNLFELEQFMQNIENKTFNRFQRPPNNRLNLQEKEFKKIEISENHTF